MLFGGRRAVLKRLHLYMDMQSADTNSIWIFVHMGICIYIYVQMYTPVYAYHLIRTPRRFSVLLLFPFPSFRACPSSKHAPTEAWCNRTHNHTGIHVHIRTCTHTAYMQTCIHSNYIHICTYACIHVRTLSVNSCRPNAYYVDSV